MGGNGLPPGLRQNHWLTKRYAKFCCKKPGHGPEFLAAGCQECIDGWNAFQKAEMVRKYGRRKA